MFDDLQLKAWMEDFLGYGNREGRYWLVGMEEGGGGSEEDVQARLDTWVALGRPPFADLAAFHEHPLMNNPARLKPCEMPRLLFQQPNPQLQHTWKALVNLVVSAEGTEKYDPPAARLAEYQALQLGRATGRTVLTELLPLPARSTKDWLYGDLTHLPELRRRSLYHRVTAPRRAGALRALIDQCKPAGVVFYSIDQEYRRYWKSVADAQFTIVSASGIEVARRDDMVFMIIAHPRHYNGADYFLEAGRILALEIERRGSTPHIYSRAAAGKIDRSFYRRFWKKLFADPQHSQTVFARKKPSTGSLVPVKYSSRKLPTSFMYGLSIAGRWAVAQFNVPKVGRTPTQTTALLDLIDTLKARNISSAFGPCETQEVSTALYVKHAFHREIVDEHNTKDLHEQMLRAMMALKVALEPFI